jgi:hypothetical protein
MSEFPLHGTFSVDGATGLGKWVGKWAMNMDDLTGKDDHKRSPFEYIGKPVLTTSSTSGIVAPTTSSSSESTPLPSVDVDGMPMTPMPVVSGVVFPSKWNGFMKMRIKQGLQRIQEAIQTISFVPVDEEHPHEFNVTIHGDNRLGQFLAEGKLTIDPDTLKGPMNMTKKYIKFWSPESKRPVRKRAPSTTMSEAEKAEVKRRKVDKTLKNLVGISSSAEQQQQQLERGRQSARTRVAPAHLRRDPAAELDQGLKLWVRDCYILLENVRSFDIQAHRKFDTLCGCLFKPVPLDGWIGSETYLPVLKRHNSYPIDLGTIQDRLKKGDFYESHHSFASDVRRVFHNAFVFNADPKNFIRSIASKLSKKFEELYKPMIQKDLKAHKAKIEAMQKKELARRDKERNKQAKEAKRKLEAQKKREKKKEMQNAKKKLKKERKKSRSSTSSS